MDLVKYYLYLSDVGSDFLSAARNARELAAKYGNTIEIRRTEEGWFAFVPTEILKAERLEDTRYEDERCAEDERRREMEDDALSDLHYEEALRSEYQREVVGPLLSEFFGSQDNYSRSDEDGWFYPDDDEVF